MDASSEIDRKVDMVPIQTTRKPQKIPAEPPLTKLPEKVDRIPSQQIRIVQERLRTEKKVKFR